MGIAGPRLDRPSLVGDEGRPRATSLTIAVAVTLGCVAATAVLLDISDLASGIASGVVLFVTGMALLKRPGFRSRFGGHLCLHAGTILFVGTLAYALVTGHRVLTLGYVAALFGVGTAWTDTLDRETFRETAGRGGGSYGRLLLVFVAGLVLLAGGWAAVAALRALVAVRTPGAALLGLSVLLTGVCLAVTVALAVVPLATIVEELPDRRVRRWRLLAALATGGSFLYVLVTSALVGLGRIDVLVGAVPPLALVTSLLTSWPVVGLLATIGALAVGASLVAWAVPAIANRIDSGDSGTLATWAGGTVLAFFLLFALVSPFAGPPLLAAFVVPVALVGIPVVLGLLLLVPSILTGSYTARQATGAAVSATGLLAVSVGSAFAGLPTPVTLCCIAGAAVVWDTTTFGAGLTAELGHIPETRRLELYHALVSVGVGGATVLVLSVLDGLRGYIAPTTLTAVLAVAAAVLLVLAARGQ